MARTRCPECDLDVVVDPTGRCPEGHLVPVVPAPASREAARVDEDAPTGPIRRPGTAGETTAHGEPVVASQLLAELEALPHAEPTPPGPPAPPEAPAAEAADPVSAPEAPPAPPTPEPAAAAAPMDPSADDDPAAELAEIDALFADPAPAPAGPAEDAPTGPMRIAPPAATEADAGADGTETGPEGEEPEPLFGRGAATLAELTAPPAGPPRIGIDTLTFTSRPARRSRRRLGRRR